MKKKFEQLSNKPSYMKHNGGLLFRSITKKKFEFKTKIKKIHLNKAGITHGGYICTIIDAGAGFQCESRWSGFWHGEGKLLYVPDTIRQKTAFDHPGVSVKVLQSDLARISGLRVAC